MKSKPVYFALDVICKAFNKVGLKPIQLAYFDMGILKYENYNVSGEKNFLEKILKKLVDLPNPVFFDVGANLGVYSVFLRTFYPSAVIHAFEPNPNTFTKLIQATDKLNVRCNPVGLSSCTDQKTLYTYSSDLSSGHASMYNEVFKFKHNTPSETTSIDIQLITLDDYCNENNIDKIDFLKVDTEGHELEALKGGLNMINEGKIGVIQFEFDEMNVESRVFLKDYYNLLKNYEMFRLDTHGLKALGAYSSTNEIFRFQNIIAIHKDKINKL